MDLSKDFKKINKEYKKIAALQMLSAISEWDSETYMPEKAVSSRAFARSELSSIMQDFMLKISKKLKKAEAKTLHDKAIKRVIEHSLRYYERVPKKLIKQINKSSTIAKDKWLKAKKKKDFSIFEKDLEKVFSLMKESAEFYGYEKTPYDALLDMHEEALTNEEVKELFSKIKKEIIKYVKKADPNYKHKYEDTPYKKENMEKLNLDILKLFDFPFKRARLDVTAHPMTIGISKDDVRISTWYDKKDFKRSLFATIHEFGHALYELQLPKDLQYSPIGQASSFAIHESQSRFWENHIGKNPVFLESNFSLIKKYMPFVEKDELNKYVNFIRPDAIRVEADEITYHLHIIIRYEIEKDIIEGKISAKDAKDVWNEKYEKYLGYEVKNDAEGILQDIHWSITAIGYFPTYSLGSMLSAQIYYKIKKTIDFENKIENKNFKEISKYLEERVHRHGSVYTPKELIKIATGEKLNADYFLRYIKEKFS